MGKGVHYLMDKYTSKYIPEWKLYILEYILLLTENKFRKENLWIETSILSRVVKHPIVQWKISLIAEETWFSLIHRQIKTGEPNALGIAHILYVIWTALSCTIIHCSLITDKLPVSVYSPPGRFQAALTRPFGKNSYCRISTNNGSLGINIFTYSSCSSV